MDERKEIMFKKGDKVKILKTCSEVKKGRLIVLKYGSPNGSYMDELWAEHCACPDNWKLVTPAKKLGRPVGSKNKSKLKVLKIQNPLYITFKVTELEDGTQLIHLPIKYWALDGSLTDYMVLRRKS